jgi:dTDP-4-amino-4,6-dideoxygalactose transaminase
MFPNAEEIGARTMSLPLSARLSEADVGDVVDAVLKVSDGLCRASNAYT